MGMLPPVLMEIRAKAGEAYAEMGKVATEHKKMVNSTEGGNHRMASSFKTAGAAGGAIVAGVAGAAVVVGAFSVEAAMAAQVTEAKLATSVKNAGGNFEKLKPQLQASSEGMVKYGFSANQGQQALATLTTSLKDPAKAMKDMSVVADLARTKNIGLNEAALLVAKASQGQVRPLKALGIDLPVYAGNAQAVALANTKMKDAQQKVNDILAKTPDAANASSKAHSAYVAAVDKAKKAQELFQEKQASGDKIMAALSSRVKGQAAAFGETFKGKIEAAKAALEGMGEKIGNLIIPVLLQMAKAGQQLFTWLGQNKGVLIALGVVLGVVAGTLVAVYVAQKVWGAYQAIARGLTLAWAAAQWVVNAAMDANPIGLIILAIAALVAAIIWLVMNWKTVSAFLTSTWQHVADFFVSVGRAIASWWNGLWTNIGNWVRTTFGPAVNWVINTFRAVQIGMVIIGGRIAAWWNGLWAGIGLFFRSVWAGVSAYVSGVFNGIVGFFRSAGATISSIWSGLWSNLANIVSGAFNGVVGVIRGVMNGVIGAINGVIDGINGATSVAGAVGIHIGSIGHIPSLDVGGWVPGGAGAPVPILAHGEEFMLSRDMLSGRRSVPPSVAEMVARNAAAYAGRKPADRPASSKGDVTVNAVTNASAGQIAAKVGWEIRRQG